MRVRVAIPIWQGRVSPVFDAATRLCLLELDDGRELDRRNLDLPPGNVFQAARTLRDHQINVLLCGAISRCVEDTLRESGLEVWPWICGDVDEVVSAYVRGQLRDERFLLPGCGRRRRGRGCGQGAGRGRGRHKRNNREPI